jgi:hypothetical protein
MKEKIVAAVFALVLVGLGVYSCFNGHPIAGGWVIFCGIMVAGNNF